MPSQTEEMQQALLGDSYRGKLAEGGEEKERALSGESLQAKKKKLTMRETLQEESLCRERKRACREAGERQESQRERNGPTVGSFLTP